MRLGLPLRAAGHPARCALDVCARYDLWWLARGNAFRQIVSDHSVCSLQRRGRRAARKVACGCTMGACVGVARVTAHCAASYGYMRCVCTALTVVAAREAVLLVQQLLPLEHGGCAFVAAVLAVRALSAANGGHPRCLSVICASANAMSATVGCSLELHSACARRLFTRGGAGSNSLLCTCSLDGSACKVGDKKPRMK